MKIKISLGFTVEVDEDGRFYLPDRKFTTAELKRVVREVNRQLGENTIDLLNVLNEVLDDE